MTGAIAFLVLAVLWFVVKDSCGRKARYCEELAKRHEESNHDSL